MVAVVFLAGVGIGVGLSLLIGAVAARAGSEPDAWSPPWLAGGGGCPVRMRSPEAISCCWPCQAGVAHHAGNHVWDGGGTHVEYTHEQAIRSWNGPFGTVAPEHLRRVD